MGKKDQGEKEKKEEMDEEEKETMTLAGWLGDKVNNNNDKLWTLAAPQESSSREWAVQRMRRGNGYNSIRSRGGV